METEGTRIKYAKKIFSPPRDTPKRKKQSRKESESKQPPLGSDSIEAKLPGFFSFSIGFKCFQMMT